MKTYNVLLNSNNRVVGTTVSTAKYYFDWYVMEEGEYTLSWGFASSGVDTTVNKVGLVSVSLGQSKNYMATSTNIRGMTTNIIGIIVPNENDPSSFCYGDRNINGDIVLMRPTTNEFIVSITTMDGLPWVDSALAQMPEYSLSLTFTKL